MKTRVWARALQESIQKQVEKAPPGWQTMRQIAAELGKSESQSRRVVVALLAEGRAEHRYFATLTNGGGLRKLPHYRLKP